MLSLSQLVTPGHVLLNYHSKVNVNEWKQPTLLDVYGNAHVIMIITPDIYVHNKTISL